MSDIKKEDLIFGFTIIPETYCERLPAPLTKEVERKIFIYKIKEITIDILLSLGCTIGLILQIGGWAYLAGTFFKMGSSS